MKKDLHTFMSKGVDASKLPPQTSIERIHWHPLRKHLLFMTDVAGMTNLIQYQASLVQILPTLSREFILPKRCMATSPPFQTAATLRPEGDQMHLRWRPDGSGITTCLHYLKIDGGVEFDGEALHAVQQEDGWSVAWPDELKMALRVDGTGDYNLILNPASFDLGLMLSTVDLKWLEEARLREDYVSAVWEWQKLSLLWLTLARVE